MSGRNNRGQQLPMKGGAAPPGPPPHGRVSPPMHDHLYGSRASLGHHHHHPALAEKFRESQLGLGHRPPPIHHAAILEEQLSAQHQDIQALLSDNQGLAATHVALKQELEAAQHKLQRMVHIKESMRADTDARMREMREKSVYLEGELRGTEAMKAELAQVHADIKELTAVKQDLHGQVQVMTQDLARMTADLKRMPALRADVEAMKHELQRASAATEYEKKGFAENYEHGQMMEKKLISMAREMEMLRAEISNAEKRARAAAAAGNPGPGYNTNYGSAEVGYAGSPYPAIYGMNPAQPGMENFPQYGAGPSTAWNAYDMQRAQGHR